MRKKTSGILAVLIINLWAYSLVLPQIRDRSEIPEKYKWDLTDLFASDETWIDAKNRVDKKIESISKYNGTLAESASNLLVCFKFRDEIGKELRRLSSYSWNKSRQDTRNSQYRAMDQAINQLFTKFNANASFIEPEIMAVEQAAIQKFLEAEPGLKPYTFYLKDLLRRKKHTLSAGEEKVIAETGLMSLAPSSIYNALINSNFIHTEVTLSTGETIKLDQANFRRYRSLTDKEDRELVYRAFYEELNEHRNTFGALANAKVNMDLFNTRARGYSDGLEMTLSPSNIPVTVFQNLIDSANKNLDKFHRYLNIRKRILGVDTLNYTDLSVPAFTGVDLNYDIEEAKEIILETLKPMGITYTSIVKKAFESRWIDFYPTPGKRSGAYSDFGAYGEHPYILMNYTGRYTDMATLIHELGHSLHRYFTDRTQPFPTSNYSSFVAEVASTFNEKLLKKKVLEKVKDNNIRLYLLLANIERSIFDQAQVSEFELRIHQEVENGNALTGDTICKFYLEILKKYYGHDQGVCIVPDFIDMAWIFDRQLFINTYRIYVYATSQTAATALAEKVLVGEKNAVKKYLDFLSAGGSEYPVDVLKKAGVDMTTSEPFEKTMGAMVWAMGEIEKILKKKGL